MDNVIIAIDPGREKCGIAVVHREKGTLEQRVILTAELGVVVKEYLAEYDANTVIIGDGTSSQEAQQSLEGIRKDGEKLTIIPVDEYRTTDEARRRYWREHPPRGFMRLIPVTMQVPPQPVDDYVAIILAERYFNKK